MDGRGLNKMEKPIMKINGGVSVGNLLVIFTLLASMVYAFAQLPTMSDLKRKADKGTVDTHFLYITKELEKINRKIDDLMQTNQ